MEEVINKMVTALCNEESKSEFEDFYKNWGRLNNQEERRKEILETQKSNRKNVLDTSRGILELVKNAEDNDIFHSKKKVYYRPRIYVAGFDKASSTYNNVLMISEWMVEKPEDFQENWYVVPCPKGARMLVVSNRGITKCYTKLGKFRFQWSSALPGGNRYEVRNKVQICVLDCFYNESNDTFYVLDFLAWNNQPMTECDTEFRYFWLQSQFAEMSELSNVSKSNEKKIVLLPKVSCSPDEINRFMMTFPHFNDGANLDGLLFYHKKAHYVPGETPLVGWLYPYMVQEVLGEDITVLEHYLKERPEYYVNQETYIKEFNKNMEEKRMQRASGTFSMDTADTSDLDVHKEMESDADEAKANNVQVDEMRSDSVSEKIDTD